MIVAALRLAGARVPCARHSGEFTLAERQRRRHRTVLAADARLGPVDHYGELGTPPPATPVEGGSIEGRITDPGRPDSISTAWRRGSAVPNIAPRGTGLQAGVPVGLVDVLLTALIATRSATTAKASASATAAICAMPARRFADLLDVPGITEGTRQRADGRGHRIARGGPINANTAAPAP